MKRLAWLISGLGALVACASGDVTTTSDETTPVVACTSNDACANEEYCDFPIASRCGKDARGVCRKPPADCASAREEVCGCDGQTYDTACLAAAAGVAIADENACKVDLASVACSGYWAPVCGKDRKTYANVCWAVHAEMPIIGVGECSALTRD